MIKVDERDEDDIQHRGKPTPIDPVARMMSDHTSPDVEPPAPPSGYGCPPINTQYRLGQSGNRKGRPKGSRNWKTVLLEVLSEKVKINDNGKVRQISKAEAIVKTAMRRAVQGDAKSAASIISLAQKLREIDDPSRLAKECGIAIVPRRCETHEEWERLYGADARGEKYFRSDGSPKPPTVTRPFTIETGDRLVREGKLDEALGTYRRALKLCETQLKRDENDEQAWNKYRVVYERLGSLALCFLLEYKFAQALEVIEQAIECATCAAPPDLVDDKVSPVPWLEATHILVLLFLNRAEEGRRIYLRYSSLKVTLLKQNGPTSEVYWLSVTLLPIFPFLRRKGLNHPVFREIEAAAAAKGIKPDPELMSLYNQFQ